MTPGVPEVSVREAARAVEGGALLLDVREPFEREICRIDGALEIPLSRLGPRLGELDPGRDTYVLCHHGIRSALVVSRLRSMGHSACWNVRGGIDAWARELDAGLATY